MMGTNKNFQFSMKGKTIKLSIKVFGAFLAMLLVFACFNYAIAGNDKIQTSSGYELSLVSDRDNFKMDESVDLDFKLRKQRNVFSAFGHWVSSIWTDEYKNIKIDTKVLDNSEKESAGFAPEVVYNKNGNFNLKINNLPRAMKPGKYQVSIKTESNGNVSQFTQDFSWGVIAFNSNKATYKVGDNGYLQFAVLDDGGSTLCDADLSAVITAPNGKKAKLSTDNGKIIKNPECKPNNVISSPDYYANYIVEKAGEY